MEMLLEQTNTLEAALSLASQGFKIIQLHRPTPTGCSCGESCKSAGKHPVQKNWMQHATDDFDVIRRLWKQFPNANIGVPMGSINGIFALDVDGDQGKETLKQWITEYGYLPSTLQVETGGGGIQLWYKIPEGKTIPNSVKKIGINIDLRGEGGQSVAPGSIHKSGKIYKWSPGRSPREIKPALPPEWLMEKIEQIAEEQEKAKQEGIWIDEEISLNPNRSVDMGRVLELTARSKAFKEITHGEKEYPSASERDLAIANILAVNDWSNQDITDFLLFYRKQMNEDLKHPLYYKLTVGKARKWAEEEKVKKMQKELEPFTVMPFEEEPEPIPLPKKVKASEFPVQVFPEPLKQYLNTVSKALQVPPDFLGVHMLTILGAAIGNTREIEIKRGWRQKPNLYSCLIADTGSGKSPSLSKAFEPVKTLQKDSETIYQLQKSQYNEELLEYERKLKEWKDRKGSIDEKPTEPVPPTKEELYCSSTTIEALLMVLEKNQRGVIVKMDELTAWIKSLGQYKGGKGDDKEHYLSLWSGEDIKINRVKDGGESKFIPNPFLSVTGNIPPDCLQDLEGAREDGFIDRILFSYPEEQKAACWTWDDIPKKVTDLYERFIHSLYSLKTDEDMKPKVIRFDDETKQLWADWYNEHAQEMNSKDFNPRFRGPWAKMPNQLARLALIMHTVRFVSGETDNELEIDQVSMLCAMELLEYFKTHAKKVYNKLGQTPADQRILDVIEWIKEKGGTVTKREIVTFKVGGCKKASEAEILFTELVDYGFGRIVELKSSSGKGRPSRAFTLFEYE